MTFVDFIRSEFGIGKKYNLEWVDGCRAPFTHHEDAFYIDSKTGKATPYPHSYGTYCRSLNKMRVGRDWYRELFPGRVAREKLTGVAEDMTDSDIAVYRRIVDERKWLRDATQNATESARAWDESRARMIRSTALEEEAMYA